MAVDQVPDLDERGSRRRARLRTLVHLVPFATLLGVLLYYHLVVGPGGDLYGSYEPKRMDWLFAFALLLLTQFGLLPLVTNRTLTRRRWNRYKRSPLAVAALAWTVLFVGVGLLAPLVMADPKVHILESYQPPVFTSISAGIPPTCAGEVANGMCHGSWTYPFGTQQSGKGVFSYVLYGARSALEVGLTTAMLLVTVGTAVGVTAAHVGGWTDELLMRYVDVQQSIPAVFVYLAVVAVYELSPIFLVLVFGLFSWGGIARIVRSEALKVKQKDFMRAASNAGAGYLYGLRKHVLPNVSGTVITTVSVQIPFFIIVEATMAYLDHGDTAVTSWGVIIDSGIEYGVANAWWISTIPVVVLALTVASINVVGDRLQHALDPRDA